MSESAEVAELRRQLEDEVATLRRIMEITAALNTTHNLDSLLPKIMGAATELLKAETSSLLLVDEETGDLIFKIAGEEIVDQRVPMGQGIAGWVVQNGEPLIVNDPATDTRFFGGIDEASGFQTKNILAVPLRVRDRTIGVVEVINKIAGGFSGRDLERAQALTNQAAIAVDNSRMYARLADAVVTSRMSYRL
jgi:GAF domain-containing protein